MTRALHFAAELLHRQGIPGNDRLIVSVSDGADWKPKGEEATGEAVRATSDPIALMEELHNSIDVNLHAVGISDEQIFMTWWNQHHARVEGQPHISMVPNHALIQQLVQVGGGDPTRTCGIDVLRDYFVELGQGITHRVGRPAQPCLAALQKDDM